MRFILSLIVFVMAFAAAAGAESFRHGTLVIEDARIPTTHKAAKIAAGYMTITNTGGEADRLVTVSASHARRGEIHEMEVADGIMRMRPLADGIEIPAGGVVELKPGGLHIMLMDIYRPRAHGESVMLELVFEKAGRITLTVPVVPAGGREYDGHKSGAHKHKH